MKKRKWMGWVAIGTSLVSSGLLTDPANAGNPAAGNQSDITGTNIWNNTAPIFRGDGKLKPEILDQAERLDQQLEEASETCCNAAVPTGPRRFARRPSNQVCETPNCERLSNLVEETKDFLSDVNRMQTEQRTASRNRIW